MLELSPVLKYGAVVLISIFEGPILFTISGFFVRLDADSFLPIFIIIGNFVGDILWYCFGYFFAGKIVRSRGSFLGVTGDHLLTAEKIFEKYGGRMLFLSKATLGFGTSIGIPAMLASAGMLKVPFWRYMKYNAAGEVLLLTIFMTIGYVFGISYQAVSKDMRVLTIITLPILLIIGLFVVRHYLAKKGSALT